MAAKLPDLPRVKRLSSPARVEGVEEELGVTSLNGRNLRRISPDGGAKVEADWIVGRRHGIAPAARQRRDKIVTIGGGTGHFALLTGLKRLNDPALITALTGVTDSGGSSGALRSDLGVLPPGDARQCLLALAPDSLQKELVHLFHFRFSEGSPWEGHNPINIELAALELTYGGQELAIQAFQTIHGIPGQVLPISLNRAHLVAHLSTGKDLFGEAAIDTRARQMDFNLDERIEYISLSTTAFPNPHALRAIEQADVIIFAPGDLYTSILPHLLVENVAETIAGAAGRKVLCANLMTKPGETDLFKASNFIAELLDYLGRPCLDLVLLNANSLTDEVLERYRQEGQFPVENDLDACRKLLPRAEFKVVPLANYSLKQRVLRHDPDRLARAILGLEDSELLSELAGEAVATS